MLWTIFINVRAVTSLLWDEIILIQEANYEIFPVFWIFDKCLAHWLLPCSLSQRFFRIKWMDLNFHFLFCMFMSPRSPVFGEEFHHVQKNLTDNTYNRIFLEEKPTLKLYQKDIQTKIQNCNWRISSQRVNLSLNQI